MKATKGETKKRWKDRERNQDNEWEKQIGKRGQERNDEIKKIKSEEKEREWNTEREKEMEGNKKDKEKRVKRKK
jgi:hypothetical protein